MSNVRIRPWFPLSVIALTSAITLGVSMLGCQSRQYNPAQGKSAPKEALFGNPVDRAQVLFGVEYTFQDETMVNEPGRNEMTNPYKEAKTKAFAEAYLQALGLEANALRKKTTWKPGYYISAPDGDHVVNPEPVTIEVNTPPKTRDEILKAATPIFQAAKAVSLVPYVRGAAERSGMGHIHVGARTLEGSPFYRSHNLLRNLLAYAHNHPSVLFGFSEAYDLGFNSNIESYYERGKLEESRQEDFASFLNDFDSWYRKQDALAPGAGLNTFLKLLKEKDGYQQRFFHHYRVINLEHLKPLTEREIQPNVPGKYTVEFRGFRPQGSPEHAVANADLLIALMERNSRVGELEPFRVRTQEEFDLFKAPSLVEADWEIVRADLGIKNELLDAMIREYVENARSNKILLRTAQRGALEVSGAYSVKEDKGKAFEVRFDAKKGEDKPRLTLNGVPVFLQKIAISGNELWVGYFTLAQIKTTAEDMKAGKVAALFR